MIPDDLAGAVVKAKIAEEKAQLALAEAQRGVQAAEAVLKAARTATSTAWEAHSRNIAECVQRALEQV